MVKVRQTIITIYPHNDTRCLNPKYERYEYYGGEVLRYVMVGGIFVMLV